MRRQDEILSLLDGADASFRLILLDLAGDLTPVHDSASIARVLSSNLVSPSAWSRLVASSSSLRFSSAWIPADFAIAAPVAGTWSMLHRAGQVVAPIGPPDERLRARQACLAVALLLAMEPIARVLADARHRDSGWTPLDLLCLSRIPVQTSIEALCAGLDVASPSVAPEIALALARSGTRQARDAFLAQVSRRPERAPAQMLVGLQHLGPGQEGDRSEDAVRILEAAICRAGQNHLAAASLALGGLAGPAAARLAVMLASRANPWVTCHLLIALARAGAGLETAIRLHDASSVGLIKTLAVRVAGSIESPDATAFLERVVDRGEDSAQALALELLGRRDVRLDPGRLDRLTRAPHWRVRLNAALLLALVDPDRALPPLLALLTGESEIERASGAFALAYLEDSQKVLVRMLDDPSEIVRLEAISSLARHPGAFPVRALTAVALGGDARLALRALQALAWTGAEGGAGAMAQLMRAAGERPDPAWRAAYYRMLGRIAAAYDLSPAAAFAPGLLSTDVREVIGCLDGMMLAGIPVDDAFDRSPVARDPGVRAHRLLAQVLRGRLEGLSEMASLLEPGLEGRDEALACLWTLIHLTPWLGRSPDLAGLEHALDPTALSTTAQEVPEARPDALPLATPRAGAGHSPVPQAGGLPVQIIGPPGAVGPAGPAALPGAGPPTASRERWVPASPVESDLLVRPGSPVRPRLPSQAAAIADLARPWAGKTRRAPAPREVRSGYYTPLPADRSLMASALALAALVLWLVVGIATHRGAPPDRQAPRPSETPADVMLLLTRNPGTSGGAVERRWVAPGETLHVPAGARTIVTGPYPGPSLAIDPGEVQIVSCKGRTARALGCDLTVRVKAGSYRVDTRPGNSAIEIDALGQVLTGRGAHFSVRVAPGGGYVKVWRGTVRLAPPLSREVDPGQSFTWGILPGMDDGGQDGQPDGALGATASPPGPPLLPPTGTMQR